MPPGSDEQLEKLEIALQEAQAELAEQRARLDALGSGREESMRLLSEARAELARVTSERDQLQERLIAIEGMQTETVALPDDQDLELDTSAALPSIDEVIASLDSLLEESQANGRGSRARGQAVEPPDAEWQEMIPPEEIAPEEFAGQAQSGEGPANPDPGQLLVYMDSEQPVQHPIRKEVMTIGRSESADIRCQDGFLSRIHARIVPRGDGIVIEDAGSKNGLKVNSKAVKDHNLKHGDVIGIGTLRFMFVDTRQQS